MSESRRQRGLRLGRLSWEVLRADRRLMIFPLTSATVSLLLGAASFAVADGLVGGGKHQRAVIVLGGIIVSFPVTFVTLFSGVALAAVLAAKLDKAPLAAGEGWRAARRRTPIIAAWTLLVCTVGAVLRLLEEYVPFGGKVAAFVLDLSWSLATMFAVPVLTYEQLGTRATLRRSSELFRQRWGEQVGGLIAIDLSTGLLAIPAALAIVAGVAAGGSLGMLLVLTGGAVLVAVQAFSIALNQVYRVFLYQSALGISTAAGPFSPDDLTKPL